MDGTLPTLFLQQATRRPTATLFLVKRAGTYHPITWAAAREQVEVLGRFLLARQVAPGDRVLILSENRPEWAIADLAIQSAGAWSVPIYPSLTADEIRAISQDCSPVSGIASNLGQVEKLLQIQAQVPSLRTIIMMEPAPCPAGVVPWSEALGKGSGLSAGELEQRRAALRPQEVATLIYTSGTTGEPKGVMLSHWNFLSNVEACLQVIPLSDVDIHLSFLPLSHVFERMAGWYIVLSTGGCIAYAESMETLPQNMLEVRPTVMLGVPRFFEKLYARIQESRLQAPPAKRRIMDWAFGAGRAVRERRVEGRPIPVGLRLRHALADRLVFHTLQARLGGRLRFFVSGSAPLSKEIAEFFFDAGVTILEGYGLTETSPVIAANRLPLPRFGSVGQPLPGVEVRIAEDGEILTRGPHVMQGYFHKPEATAEAIVDGWFHTGDIGHRDAEGYLFITDRKKDLIKTAGGKFVAPQKLEKLLMGDPYIAQAVVYGDKQPYCVALLVPNFAKLEEVAARCALQGRPVAALVGEPRVVEFYWQRAQAAQQGLPSFEQVKRIALVDHEFSQVGGELTPTMKAKRAVIVQRYETLLRGLYASPPP